MRPNTCRWLFDDEANHRSVREAAVDGTAAIVAEVTRDKYDYDGTETAKIFLDEGFLPLKLEYDSSLARFGSGTTEFRYEFVDAATLPDDFFSPEPLKALARTPLDDIRDAEAAGVPIYWLGESYEDVILDEASFSLDAFGGDPAANYSYAPADFSIVTPCVHISAYSAAAWEILRERREQNSGGGYSGETWEMFVIGGAAVTTYRGLWAPPPGPNAGPIPDGYLSPPRDPSLPDVPEDDGRGRRAVIEPDAGVVEVDANCGPVGSNEYRTDAAFRRLIQSLRPFQP